MKSLKMLFTSIAVAAMLAGCSDSQVNSVKKGILEIDKSRSIEQAFSVNMENMEWEKFTSDDNITFVKFVGVWKKAETYSGRFNVFPGDKVMIQFIINADDTFRFSYGEIQDANGITSQYTPHNMMTASIKEKDNNDFLSLMYMTSLPKASSIEKRASRLRFSEDGKTLIKAAQILNTCSIPQGVTMIAKDAFKDCFLLTSVTIPNSVTTIGEGAFSDCSSLTNVTISNGVKTIGHMAFWDCSSLTSVTIPNSVTTIGTWSFKGCSSLTSVMIPNSVKTIGGMTFMDCSSLTSVRIPKRFQNDFKDIFYDCPVKNPNNRGVVLY